jgi:hypothetical protein
MGPFLEIPNSNFQIPKRRLFSEVLNFNEFQRGYDKKKSA